MAETEEEYRREEIRRFIEKRWITADIESGIFISDGDEMEDLLLEFMSYVIDESMEE